MDALIPVLGAKLFSGDDILKLCDGKVKVVTYSDLQGFRDLEALLEPAGAAAVLYESKEGTGHWCAVIRSPAGDVEFFDSLGGAIDTQLDNISPAFRARSGQESRHLSRMINDALQNGYAKSFRSSLAPLQEPRSLVNTCGRWCGLRIAMRHLGNRQFAQLFARQQYPADWYVTALTLFV